ncbi:MAG: hypothetical protein ACK55I_42920, partial [bacterium]
MVRVLLAAARRHDQSDHAPAVRLCALDGRDKGGLRDPHGAAACHLQSVAPIGRSCSLRRHDPRLLRQVDGARGTGPRPCVPRALGRRGGGDHVGADRDPASLSVDAGLLGSRPA